MKIIFLGSGGGRWVTLSQRLRTGGFRIHDSRNIHVDPGPGALLGLHEYNISFEKTDGVVVTHCHPDHYNDAGVMVEAMTRGMTVSKGALLGSESVVHGKDGLGPGVSGYHRSRVKDTTVGIPGRSQAFCGLETKALPAYHSDPTTFGFKMHLDDGTLTYTSDTSLKDELLEEYSGSRIIIINTTRPGKDRIPNHLCTEDAIKIVSHVRPELAVTNHFGMKVVGKEDREAALVEKATGVRTVAARAGLAIEAGKEINIGRVFNRLSPGQTRLKDV